MSWTFINDAVRKARKEHKCELCALPIVAGVPYIERCGAIDGKIYKSRMHLICESKTRDWEDDDWLMLEPLEFRKYELEFVEP